MRSASGNGDDTQKKENCDWLNKEYQPAARVARVYTHFFDLQNGIG